MTFGQVAAPDLMADGAVEGLLDPSPRGDDSRSALESSLAGRLVECDL